MVSAQTAVKCGLGEGFSERFWSSTVLGYDRRVLCTPESFPFQGGAVGQEHALPGVMNAPGLLLFLSWFICFYLLLNLSASSC